MAAFARRAIAALAIAVQGSGIETVEDVKGKRFARNVLAAAATKIISASERLPTTGCGYAHILKPELAEKVKQAFFSFNWEGSELLKEFGTSIPARAADPRSSAADASSASAARDRRRRTATPTSHPIRA